MSAPTPLWSSESPAEPGGPRRRPPPGTRYRETVAQLAAAQKSRKGAPAYSVLVNRRLGRLLAAAAHHTGLTPNVVTLLSAAASFSGIAVLAVSSPSWTVGGVVCALLVLGYALDAADGQLARLRGGGSPSGEWLDHMVDSLKISSLHLAVLVHTYRHGELEDRWLLVPVGYAAVAAVSFFAQILNEQLVRNHGGPSVVSEPGGTERASLVRSVLKVPTDYGLLCLVFVLLGAPDVFLVAYGAMFAGSAGYLAVALVKWYGDVRGLDPRSPG